MQADFTIIDKNILKINEKEIKNINIVDTYLNGINNVKSSVIKTIMK